MSFQPSGSFALAFIDVFFLFESAAAAVVASAVIVAVASDENDYQENDPSTAVVTKCVTHNMCLPLI